MVPPSCTIQNGRLSKTDISIMCQRNVEQLQIKPLFMGIKESGIWFTVVWTGVLLFKNPIRPTVKIENIKNLLRYSCKSLTYSAMLDDLSVYITICYVLVTLGDITSLSSCDPTHIFFFQVCICFE